MSHSPVKVLVVDDSIIFRKAVEAALADEPGVDVVGSVRNGEKALEFIAASPPDAITLDLEMPGMNGIDVLKAIQSFNEGRPDASPVRAIMLSSYTKSGADVTIEALAAGAFDFIEKPESSSPEESIAKLKRALLEKLKALPEKGHHVSAFSPKSLRQAKPAPARAGAMSAVAIGVSTGGPKALLEMLPELCKAVNLPILIVQHMPPGFTKSLANQLDSKCQAKVKEAEEGDAVEEGHVYIAPGGKHMCVKKAGTQVRIALNDEPPENGCRPSVDVLFRSVAAVYGSSAVAAIMTGMGCDGAKACKALNAAGARIIVQDEESSVVWGMPGAAVATGLVSEVEPLMKLPQAIKALCKL